MQITYQTKLGKKIISREPYEPERDPLVYVNALPKIIDLLTTFPKLDKYRIDVIFQTSIAGSYNVSSNSRSTHGRYVYAGRYHYKIYMFEHNVTQRAKTLAHEFGHIAELVTSFRNIRFENGCEDFCDIFAAKALGVNILARDVSWTNRSPKECRRLMLKPDRVIFTPQMYDCVMAKIQSGDPYTFVAMHNLDA